MTNKKWGSILVAVSSCLLGERVRYDGGHKHIPYLTHVFAKQFLLISICPEIGSGLKVPRAPVELVEKKGNIRVVGVKNPMIDVTVPLSNYAKKIVNKYPNICGYIFKENSPSCGLKNVKILKENGLYEKQGQGIFSKIIISNRLTLPVINEKGIENIMQREKFIENVLHYWQRLNHKII